MLWDELPDVISPESVRLAAGCAREVEIEPIHLMSVGDRFRKQAETLADEAARQLLAADALACDLMLTEGEASPRWGPLGPVAEWADGMVSPPPVETFPDCLKRYFETRAEESGRADLQARYHDLLWLRWGLFDHARLAQAAYARAAANPDFDDATSFMTAAKYLVRAAELSVSLGLDRDATADRIIAAIGAGLHLDGAGYVCTLVEGCMDLLRVKPEVLPPLRDAVIAGASVAPAGRRFRERSLLEAAETLSRVIGDHDGARGLKLAQASSFEAEAAERDPDGGLVKTVLLKDAMDLYADAGSSADVQRLKSDVAQAVELSSGDLHTVEGVVSIPRAPLEAAVEAFVGEADDDINLLLVPADLLGLWPTPTKLEADLEQAVAEHPFIYLVRRISTTWDGRFTTEPTNDHERRWVQLTRKFAEDTAFRLAVAGVVIGMLSERGFWSAAHLTAAVDAVDPPLAASCRQGFDALLAEEGWIATHLLVPQLERAVRSLALAVGVNPTSRQAGGLRWTSLDLLLADPKVEEALGPSLTLALRRLFVDPFGPNYRNDVAHGAMEPSQDYAQVALLTTFAIMSVSARLALARSRHRQPDAAPTLETGDADDAAHTSDR